jgi:hypothetical protein
MRRGGVSTFGKCCVAARSENVEELACDITNCEVCELETIL